MTIFEKILPQKISAEISFLLLIPDQYVALQPVSQGHKKPKGAPYFYDIDIEVLHGPVESVVVDDVTVTLHPDVIDEHVWIGDFRYQIPDVSADASFEQIHRINSKLRTKYAANVKLVEEYIVVMIKNESQDPLKLARKYGKEFAQLLRYVGQPLNKDEVTETLETRISYSEKDLTIIDWNGAVVISNDEDFESELGLLKIGNYQLLRYRMFDDVIDHSLENLRKLVKNNRLSWFPRSRSILQDMVNQRLTMILDFEKVNQSLLLIGDWYTTKLYSSIVSEFYLDDWKKIVSDKLDGLGEVSEVITQNLSVSWERLADFAQIVGWTVLLVGYFVLFYLDIKFR